MPRLSFELSPDPCGAKRPAPLERHGSQIQEARTVRVHSTRTDGLSATAVAGINWRKIPVHPAADIFPLLTGAAFEALKDSIACDRQQNPIVLKDGMLLDGRNRLKACLKLWIEPKFIELGEDVDPVVYIAAASNRRNLSTSQRAMAAARLIPLYKQRRKDLAKDNCALIRIGNPNVGVRVTRNAGLVWGISYRTVEAARLIIRKGSQDLD